jgi:hypothetical protein
VTIQELISAFEESVIARHNSRTRALKAGFGTSAFNDERYKKLKAEMIARLVHNNADLYAEFGYRSCERGENLQLMQQKLKELIE